MKAEEGEAWSLKSGGLEAKEIIQQELIPDDYQRSAQCLPGKIITQWIICVWIS
jgi:hypothetical protein